MPIAAKWLTCSRCRRRSAMLAMIGCARRTLYQLAQVEATFSGQPRYPTNATGRRERSPPTRSSPFGRPSLSRDADAHMLRLGAPSASPRLGIEGLGGGALVAGRDIADHLRFLSAVSAMPGSADALLDYRDAEPSHRFSVLVNRSAYAIASRSTLHRKRA
jgi:hypothetical protein